MNGRKIIVNADDFGQSKSVNDGIIKAHEEGIVSSASLMVRYPCAHEAALYGRSNKSLSVGLHADLGEWKLENGEWKILYKVVDDIEDPEMVEKEVWKQLEMYEALMGESPTHIDSHQHVHQRSGLRTVFVRIANKLNIPLRGYDERIQYCGLFYGQNEDGSSCPECISVKGLLTILNNLDTGIIELACHPAIGEVNNTMYNSEREIETNTLCHPSVKDMLVSRQIKLISFKHFAS